MARYSDMPVPASSPADGELKLGRFTPEPLPADAVELTPMLAQYGAVKRSHPNHLVLFRMGDFYEMFGEDAIQGAKILGIALTARSAGKGAPNLALAGVPHHALDSYLGKLVRAGVKVAICDQVEDPKTAKGKVVRREVTRLVTPGTLIEDGLLEAKLPNYIAAVWTDTPLARPGDETASTRPGKKKVEARWGLAVAELSTGKFTVGEWMGTKARTQLGDELDRLRPAELIAPDDIDIAPASLFDRFRETTMTSVSLGEFSAALAHDRLTHQFGVRDLSGFGADGMVAAQRAAGALLGYLRDSQRAALGQITELTVLQHHDAMLLDYTTQRSLELVDPLTSRPAQGDNAIATLLDVLDATETPMGGRLLRAWLLRPLRDPAKISARWDAVGSLLKNDERRAGVRRSLGSLNDLERICGRLAAGTASPRDLAALRDTLNALPGLRTQVEGLAGASSLLAVLSEQLDPMPELARTLNEGLIDAPPLSAKEGGIIRPGHAPELDRLRFETRDSKEWIAQFRAREIERTGISGLKIGFNRVFGYYIELTQAQLRQTPAPADYQRRQTLANAERFITPELKEKEDIILHAEERANGLEERLFLALRATAAGFIKPLQAIAAALATLDALGSLAEQAMQHGYVRPSWSDDGALQIHNGRHPVLELARPDPSQPIVPNDTSLHRRTKQIALITGPNMAGKSTYIRQVALIVLMAHVGSFVPADKAMLPPTDRIFTRVGAMDSLARGQSTFLVEMSETANILNNCTEESLVILDEIGRGTSTYDGLSIAWSVVEYLHQHGTRRPLTLFATHYHELTALDERMERVTNLSVAVHEEPSQQRIAFLYKIVDGATDRSYGIHAARLAGMPAATVRRANDILDMLQSGRAPLTQEPANESGASGGVQLSLFEGLATHPALDRIKNADIHAMTPIQALTFLEELKREVTG